MCAVFRKERLSESQGVPGVAYSRERADWTVEADCEQCGGYRVGLQVEDPGEGELAQTRARAFLTRVHGRGGCLGCEARRWRAQETRAEDAPQVWWDTDTHEWMAWRKLPGFPRGLSMPLGIETFWAPQEVRAAARALWASDRLPLHVAHDPLAVDPNAPTIFYDVEGGRWKLSAPCFDCGSYELHLTCFGRGAVEAACDEALTCLDLVAREGCPNCRTRRERDSERETDEEPRIWYDTESRDWLVWQALGDDGDGVTLPLAIGRYDARRAIIYRAAAELLFDSELFLDEGL